LAGFFLLVFGKAPPWLIEIGIIAATVGMPFLQ
jgi:hypothetical protein